jgi:phage baseplate assembly protein W
MSRKTTHDFPGAAAHPTLGTGWAFPVDVESRGEGSLAFQWTSDEASVRQAIQIVLSTAKGERVMRPDFGCNLRSLVFSPNNGATRAAAAFEVREALRQWEPRIEVLEVTAEAGESPEQMLIEVAYRVRSTDNRFNFVYPFYLDRAAVA